MRVGFPILALCLVATPLAAGAADRTTYRDWVVEMKEAPRGPFSRLRWFCADGSVHPPKPYPCADRGGGHQHGQWSERTAELRGRGYRIANLLAGVDAAQMATRDRFYDDYAQLLIERFLIAADNGWILRKALFYRGAIQEEDEREGARSLLEYLAARPEWVEQRFPALRIGASLLPHGKETASAQQVRQESAALSDIDAGFLPLRAKIHGAPDAADAGRVRKYAAGVADEALARRYNALATAIDQVYQADALAGVVEKTSREIGSAPRFQELLQRAAASLRSDDSPGNRFRVTALLMADLRSALGRVEGATERLRMVDLGLRVESENFRAASELRPQLEGMTRAERIVLLGTSVEAAYGAGTIKARERAALQASLDSISQPAPKLATYLAELRYLGRVPGWATQNLRFFFFESMRKLAEIEPKAMLFVQDQLRGSPLLFYSHILDGLTRDANRLAGVRHKIFGEEVGVGFNALNPGLAVGVLHGEPAAGELAGLDSDGIYLLPETVSDLPPIAGILTAGEGNPLSHVQLLARNLGIPNVSVSTSVVDKLTPGIGKPAVLAVSPAGLVEVSELDDRWKAALSGAKKSSGVVIRPDLEKLDLSVLKPILLDDLGAADSGRSVGPKAAKLGELRRSFPAAVAPGIALPFGIFKAEVLDRPHRTSGDSIFEWMKKQYRKLELLPAGSAERATETEAFRAELYQEILRCKPSEEFRSRLKAAMVEAFGGADVGVFVRSDTNVEDLAGFTGAGLNLTLSNVVGFQEVVSAISRVWASPFTARAFAWRQSHMESPEHVYTSVLLLQSVASDKSGVLVTQDLDSGDREVLSVAVNEGLGGAVDGQAAESLRIDTRSGAVRLMASATAPWLRRPTVGGGIEKLPASGNDFVLESEEIRQLIDFARIQLPQKFPPIVDDDGNPAAADIEFGFVGGQLRLFQIRPFLESKSARGNAILLEMDRSLSGSMERSVELNEVPTS